jgi:serine/threonine protein kinase
MSEMTCLNNKNKNEFKDEIEIKQNSILDDYLLTDKRIGHGVNGYIHLCINKLDNKEYACKALKSSFKTRREIDVHYEASINCPNIVQIKDVYQNVVRNFVVYFLILE